MNRSMLCRMAAWWMAAVVGSGSLRALAEENEPLDAPAAGPAAEMDAPADPAPVEPADPDTPPPAVIAPPHEPTPEPPGAPGRPARRAADLGRAFKGSRSSKFGLSATQGSLKMPGQTRARRPKDSWRVTMDLGLNNTSGNKDTRRYNASLSAQKETDLNFYWMKAVGRYGESDREKDAENAQAEGRYERSLNRRAYAALDGLLFHDPIADVDYRARANLSLGWFLVRAERLLLGVEAGPGYLRERKGDEIDGFAAGRAAQYAEVVLWHNLRAWQSVDLVVSAEDSDVFYRTIEAGAELLLSENLGLRFTLEDRYDNAPAEEKKKGDRLTATSLAWTF